MSGVDMTAEQLQQYMGRVQLVKEVMTRLGRGSQQEASFDVRVSPSHVSSVLKGRYVDPRVLELLEEWSRVKLSGLLGIPPTEDLVTEV